MDSKKLHNHIFSTYLTLRYGVAGITFAFPILLYAIGQFVYGINLENSMSLYYFSIAPDDLSLKGFPMRAWFVGILFSIGVSLYLYKGFTDKENIALNIAGLAAIGVAVFPMKYECGQSCPMVNLHGVSAVLLFITTAYVSLKCTKDTLHYLNDKKLEASYLRKYKFIGSLMLASPVIALVISFFMQDLRKYLFFVEAAGIWAFSLYWWVKSREMAHSEAERMILRHHHS